MPCKTLRRMPVTHHQSVPHSSAIAPRCPVLLCESRTSTSEGLNELRVGRVGFEPTRVLPRRILSPLRLPFRHLPWQPSRGILGAWNSSVNQLPRKIALFVTFVHLPHSPSALHTSRQKSVSRCDLVWLQRRGNHGPLVGSRPGTLFVPASKLDRPADRGLHRC